MPWSPDLKVTITINIISLDPLVGEKVVVHQIACCQVEVNPNFDLGFYKMLNAIGNIFERTCDKVFLHVAKIFL